MFTSNFRFFLIRSFLILSVYLLLFSYIHQHTVCTFHMAEYTYVYLVQRVSFFSLASYISHEAVSLSFLFRRGTFVCICSYCFCTRVWYKTGHILYLYQSVIYCLQSRPPVHGNLFFFPDNHLLSVMLSPHLFTYELEL